MKKNNNLVFIILGIIPLLIIGYFVYSGMNGSETVSKTNDIQTSNTPTPKNTVKPRQKTKLVLPKDFGEALDWSANPKPEKYFGIKKYAESVPSGIISDLQDILKPRPDDTDMSEGEKEQRLKYIRMLGLFPRKVALPILAQLVEEPGADKTEKCEAIKSIGEIGDNESYKYLVDTVKPEKDQDIMAALYVALERNGSPEIVPYIIGILETYNSSEFPEIKGLVENVLPERLRVIAQHNAMPDYKPGETPLAELATKWREWWTDNQFGFETLRRSEYENMRDLFIE